MPRSTFKHAWQWQVLECVGKLAHAHGMPERAMILIELEGETVRAVRTVTQEERDAVTELASYLLFDPFDAPEYTWLEWRGLPRAVAEQLIGAPLPADFPSEHGVMF